MSRREELISKYERNKSLVSEFLRIYKEFLDRSNTWNCVAFCDARITNKQYFEELNRISTVEYSIAQHEAIKTVDIQEQFLDGYIQGIDLQYDNLKLLYENLRTQISRS